MLRKLTLGFTGIMAAAILIAGCSSSEAGKILSIGPTFAPESLYATNSTQNGISIYPAGSSKTGAGPQYQIGGSNTSLLGPLYVTLDSLGDIFTTTWAPGTGAATILEFKALATGNVLPYQTYTFTLSHPRGVFDYLTTFGGATTKTDVLVSSVVDASQPLSFANQLQFFTSANVSLGPYSVVAGPLTGLNVPVGVAADSSGNVYVANNQSANVEVFSFPSPSPTPSPTATPSPSPTPSPTPTGATPSPEPSVSPTATPYNVAPFATISGAASKIGLPTGVALDTNNNIYVADQASTACTPACPAILIFPKGSNGAVAPTVLAGSATKLYAPSDVKVDSNGLIYVADTTASGAGVIYVFAAGASGNVAPTATYTSPGAVTGLGLSP
jgi:hypothetical protein